MTKSLLIVAAILLLGNCYFVIEVDTDVESPRLGGGHPPPPLPLTAVSNQTASCACQKVLLSSLGPAAQYLPGAMGLYQL